jgi:hypothetical protein
VEQWAEECKMVQFVQLPKSARGVLSDSLGESIGGGLANFTGNYFANKALDNILNDPEMENADPSERQSKLQSALQPYGQYGENIFKKRMQIEQQREQEKEIKKQKELTNKKSPIFAKALKNEKLSPEEESILSPDEQLAIAKHHQALELQGLRNSGKTSKPTAYENEKGKDLAKEQIELEKMIPKIQSTVQSLARIEELANKLRGPGGYINWAIGGAKSSELDALGLAAIEPILKVFNPVGAIPTQKIELIKDKFAPKSTDFHGKLTGKLNALKFYSNQALERAQKRLNLINQYQGNPPAEVLNSFDQESSQMLDALTGEQESKKDFSNLPDPYKFSGKTMLNKKTGQKVKSDGQKWIPQK